MQYSSKCQRRKALKIIHFLFGFPLGIVHITLRYIYKLFTNVAQLLRGNRRSPVGSNQQIQTMACEGYPKAKRIVANYQVNVRAVNRFLGLIQLSPKMYAITQSPQQFNETRRRHFVLFMHNPQKEPSRRYRSSARSVTHQEPLGARGVSQSWCLPGHVRAVLYSHATGAHRKGAHTVNHSHSA